MRLSKLQMLVLNYIREHNGMSASVSVVGRALDPDYTWRNYTTWSGRIKALIKHNVLHQYNGRYYVAERYVLD